MVERNLPGAMLPETGAGEIISGPLATNQPFQVTTRGPALLRVNQLIDASGVIFEPSTQAGILEVIGYPRSARAGGAAFRSRAIRATRGVGPYLWLPVRGTWDVELAQGSAGANAAELEIFHNVSEAVASMLLAGQAPPFRLASGTTSIPAGTASSIYGGNLSAFNIPQWFGCVFLRFTNLGAASKRVALGTAATAAIGHPINTMVTQTREWRELAGRTVSVFNSGAGAEDVYWEAAFA